MTAEIRPYQPADRDGLYRICLATGDSGADGTPFYQDDPDALARLYVEPFLRFQPDLVHVLEDAEGTCGYALGALDSRAFFGRFDAELRPILCRNHPDPLGDPESWSRAQRVHFLYHHPNYFCPEPYEQYPSHLHIDLLPRAQRQGHGTRLMEALVDKLAGLGSVGVHLAMNEKNDEALGFYERLGFRELDRRNGALYLGKTLEPLMD